MDLNKIHNTLNTSSFFKVLEHSEKRILSSIIKRKEYKKDDIVFSESQSAASIYILEKGNVTLTIPGSYTIFVGRGDVFGEIAVINDTARLGTALARTTSSVLELNTEALYNDEIIPSKIALKITKVIAKKHSSLKLRRADFSTREIIQQGESDFVEFKSTLRFNLKSKKTDQNIELSAIKTVAAFLNTSVGTLLIGVSDDGSINGLASDRFPNDDKVLLHFTNLLNDKIGEKTLGFVHFEIVDIDSKKILRVEVSRSNTPVFVTFQNHEYFYVRSGPSTLSLKFSEFYNYNIKHFM